MAAGITILCRVVDNFGDIGFVWRLCKNFLQINPDAKIRLIVDDLKAFKKLAPQIDERSAHQNLFGIEVFDWNAVADCCREFLKRAPVTILECFQCGRPEWLDGILFAKNNTREYRIINIDYLTAESYAGEFHGLKSGTRSALVKKVNFMPGFTQKTGGLILDEPFLSFAEKNFPAPKNSPQKILVFSYPKNFLPVLGAMIRAGEDAEINLAQGAGKNSFLESYSLLQEKNKIKVRELDFLEQEEWDKNLLDMDILFVRGEDSLSRACLCGKPFVWDAYPQDEQYHLVKVAALLERMRAHFAPEEFDAVEKLWLLYNGKGREEKEYAQHLENAVFEFLKNAERLARGFKTFSKSLFDCGNFTEKLNDFIKDR